MLGLVMEGGAMRGLFTAGAIDVFLEENITVNGACGVSAGATFGCNYVTKQHGRPLRYCLQYRNDPRFCSYLSLLTTGDMFGAEFCYHTLPESLDPIDNEAFLASGIPFYMVATDVNSGRPIYHRCMELQSRCELEWMRAGASMPLVSQIVRAGGYELLDGGITDSIPLKYMQYKGYEKNIVILTQPADYVKQPNTLLPLIELVYRRYPNLIRAMARRHHVYNRQTAYIAGEEQRGSVFVIRPPEALPISHTTRDESLLRATYEAGRKAALENLDALRAFTMRNA